MHIAVVAHDYHIVRVFELMLQAEKHHVTCFGKLAQLARSPHQFDLLVVDPGKHATIGETLAQLATIRPKVRRILVTSEYENIAPIRRQHLPALFWPCSRRLFLAHIQEQVAPIPGEEVVTYGA